ncbi:hypothetical protein JHW44_07665 [Paracoccus seriniphilus]|nr:hypothetical protein JHW44_07665 [Paracoccus seriniphilus]
MDMSPVEIRRAGHDPLSLRHGLRQQHWRNSTDPDCFMPFKKSGISVDLAWLRLFRRYTSVLSRDDSEVIGALLLNL